MRIAMRVYLAAVIVLGVLQLKKASTDIEMLFSIAQSTAPAMTASR